ncbi:MAG TPA: hypothetical protein VFI25_17685 [Planctomycetota bacterium]|jgi:tetratricopeptide (TPR) repeat protein|nr:hypothetical protein [Planctomycetota bacterium]
MRPSLLLALPLLLLPAPQPSSGFGEAMRGAERALGAKDLAEARHWIDRALERDPKSAAAWDLRVRCSEAAADRDDAIYSLHRELALLVAQRTPKPEQASARARLLAIDPIAPDLLELSKVFLQKLEPIALRYEKERRPHSAIRVHKQMLALDPELESSRAAIQRLASAPDPSLAPDAKPKDLLEGVSREWIREHDEKHGNWEEKAVLERSNYVTETDAGYEALVRAAEAMEHMNAFYRAFFRYGTPESRKSVPRIVLRIFRNRDEYLKLGSGPPVEWSGGQFTGGAVETYVGGGGFQEMVGTLFHEAAHQFVSLATNAAGWLNEGLASFFEGSRILANGTVVTNEPADHRLFPLVERMKNGWMTNASDGIDPSKAESEPRTAPTFRIVLENEYAWGPPWYAPTWGVVYFLYNYQDPGDGRYVYRGAFQEFVDASGGKTGKGAVETFEKVVLAKPKPPIRAPKRSEGAPEVALPTTVAQLDEVWKEWLARLADERTGHLEVERPYAKWARFAVLDRDPTTAQEHFEKGLLATPNDVALLTEFATFLADQKNADRATALLLRALRLLESAPRVDAKAIAEAERLLDRWDPKRSSLARAHAELAAAGKALVARYEAAGLPSMVMDVSWRLATEHEIPELLDFYRRALESSGKSLPLWELAYNEKDLSGWAAVGDSPFQADGIDLLAKHGAYAPDRYDFKILTLDRVTSGDFSLEVDLAAEREKCNFCGLVFGRKGASNFHALMFFPGAPKEGTAASGFVDLATSFGGPFKTWRHVPVANAPDPKATAALRWHKLRLDVSGRLVDAWFDGAYLATHEFPALDVLRGSFGLVIGPGEARFRNVRFLARDPRDPAAPIERAVRMASLRREGEPLEGSFLGMAPPFPKTARWLQGERRSWDDVGPVPQLLVFWSIDQNGLIPIDPWLRDLAARHSSAGLEIVSVGSANDTEQAQAYLKDHPFPGAVGIDFRDKPGIGESFTTFSISRFNLPRLLLLDIDRTLAWEGDPGFSLDVPWQRGVETFLDAPLSELVARRRMPELLAWSKLWPSVAPALHDGDVAKVEKILQDSRGFDPKLVPAAADAQGRIAAVEGALLSLDATAASLAREERDPALAVLLDWGRRLSKPLDKKALARLQPVLEGKAARAWADVPKHVEAYRRRLENAPDPAAAAELVARLEALAGRFPQELAADLRAAVAARDAAAFDGLLAETPARVARWLAREVFRW